MKEFKESGCTLTMSERGKKISEMWKSLTPEEKKPIEEAALADKERYARELKEFNQTG